MNKRWIIWEILVTALVIAVAVSIVVFTSGDENNKAARANLRRASLAAKAFYLDSSVSNLDYRTLTSDQLQTYEPSLNFVGSTTTSTGPDVISVSAISRDQILMTAKSESGTCFAIRNSKSSRGGVHAESVSAHKCSASLVAELPFKKVGEDEITLSTLNEVLVAAKVVFVGSNNYKTLTPAQLRVYRPFLTFVGGGKASNGKTVIPVISVKAVSRDEIVMAAKSQSGTCFAIRDIANTNEGPKYAVVHANTCTGDNAAKVNNWISNSRELTTLPD